jgi:hypothetical protein
MTLGKPSLDQGVRGEIIGDGNQVAYHYILQLFPLFFFFFKFFIIHWFVFWSDENSAVICHRTRWSTSHSTNITARLRLTRGKCRNMVPLGVPSMHSSGVRKHTVIIREK